MRHPEVEDAEKGWRIADVNIRQARIKHRGMPSQENAKAVTESEDRWEQAMTVWVRQGQGSRHAVGPAGAGRRRSVAPKEERLIL